MQFDEGNARSLLQNNLRITPNLSLQLDQITEEDPFNSEDMTHLDTDYIAQLK